jgi:type III secretion protein C
MTTRHPFKSYLLACALACAMALASPQAAAETPPWPESPFSYMGKEQRLDQMLAGFARTFGLELRLDTALPDNLSALSGRSSAATPADFLNQVSAAYGLTWYYHAGVLYVSRTSDRITRLVPTKGMSGAALKKAFTEMGILDTRFGWGEVDERSAVLVSGPRTYVERIEQAMSTFPEPLADQQILVFRLKHASVDDRTIQYRDKQIVTPGVATMLRNLLGNQGPSGATVTEMADAVSPLRNALQPLADTTEAAAPAATASSAAAPSRAARNGRGVQRTAAVIRPTLA